MNLHNAILFSSFIVVLLHKIILFSICFLFLPVFLYQSVSSMSAGMGVYVVTIVSLECRTFPDPLVGIHFLQNEWT